MHEVAEKKLIKETIADINFALSGVNDIKLGLGLHGDSAIEHNLESAKVKLIRLLELIEAEMM